MAKTLISTHTASASATIDITSGIDSTYDSYEFHFVNMHPATNAAEFQFQVNASGQTGFNEVITSTLFVAYHNEAGTDTALTYSTTHDQVLGTAYETLIQDTGADADQSTSGVLTLYAPSNTTFVKHFVARMSGAQQSDYAYDVNDAGYIDVTAAIDEISFKFSTGNIDAGTIKMFGVS
jgi:hypothetical protein